MEKQINEQEALLVIRGMISQAKIDIRDHSNMYLMWGWLVFIAAISNYVLMKFTNFGSPSIPWLAVPLVGVPYSIYYSFRKRKTQRARTYIDGFLTYLWSAMGVAFFLTLFAASRLQLNTYPIIIVLYGIATFVSGGALKFKPLVVGGILCWVLAVVCFYVGSFGFEYQLLVLALSILVSYIIPGHLMKARG